jgi:hypothetical protein
VGDGLEGAAEGVHLGICERLRCWEESCCCCDEVVVLWAKVDVFQLTDMGELFGGKFSRGITASAGKTFPPTPFPISDITSFVFPLYFGSFILLSRWKL